MDAQHKVILGCMAKVHSLLTAGKQGKELFGLVERLDSYCTLHFLEEETVLKEMHYPDAGSHAAKHALFKAHLEKFAGRYEEQSCTQNVDELLFLENWFLEHFEQHERKYAEYKNSYEKVRMS